MAHLDEVALEDLTEGLDELEADEDADDYHADDEQSEHVVQHPDRPSLLKARPRRIRLLRLA